MNLENRDKSGNEEIREDVFEDDIDGEFFGGEQKKQPDDKMRLILKELEDLKSDMAKSSNNANAKRAGNESERTGANYSRASDDDRRYAPAPEKPSAKEDFSRERMIRYSDDGAETQAVMAELRRLNERLDSYERGKYYGGAIQGMGRPVKMEENYAAMPAYTPTYAPVSDNRAVLKMFDDIDVRLAHLDSQIAELSMIAVGNDAGANTKEFESLKEQISLIGAKFGGVSSEGNELNLDLTDKVLDELVRVQSSVEDIKKAMEDFERPQDMQTSDDESTAMQRQNYAAVQADTFENVQADMIDGFRNLNEQIASLHADIKIYAEEGMFSAAQKSANDEQDSTENLKHDELLDRFSAIEEEIRAVPALVHDGIVNEMADNAGAESEISDVNAQMNRLLDESAQLSRLVESIHVSDTREMLVAIENLRQDLAQFAAFKMEAEAVSVPASTLEESDVRRVIREELTSFLTANTFLQARAESASIAEKAIAAPKSRKTVVKATAKVANKNKLAAKTSSAKKPVAKKPVAKKPITKKSTTVKKTIAVKKTTAAKKTTAVKKTTAKKVTASKPSVPKTSSSNISQPKAPIAHKTVELPEIIETRYADKLIKKDGILSVPDSLARQVASKLALEQMITDPNSSKSMREKVVKTLIDGRKSEVLHGDPEESQRQRENQTFIDRMIKKATSFEE